MCQSNKLAGFDVHSVGFQLGISTFGYRNACKVQLCNYLLLCQVIFVTKRLDAFSNIRVGSDFFA